MKGRLQNVDHIVEASMCDLYRFLGLSVWFVIYVGFSFHQAINICKLSFDQIYLEVFTFR